MNCLLFDQVGYAMTTFERETDQPVIGFDMGGIEFYDISQTH